MIRGPDFEAILERHRPKLDTYEDVYKNFHQHPELSGQESHIASVAAKHLQGLKFTVHEKIGGHGVVGVLHNGSGPTILLRADMDALPVQEQTDLPYASRARMVDYDGVEKPVMHACGHDFHVTSLMAASTLLHSARKEWSGTLICLFQPAEERADGATAMVEDGLYDKVPKPHIVLGQHVVPLPAGVLATHAGTVLSAADSLAVRIYGRGGHGSAPQNCIDPVVIASYIVVRLQSIVSRVIGPDDFAVVTCGSIHAGETDNVIPDYLDLKLNVRTYEPDVREKVLDAIKRIIEAECEASGVAKKPSIRTTARFPVTKNSPEIVEAVTKTFKKVFRDGVWEMPRNAASEDFSILATSIGVPYMFWGFGGTDAEKWNDAAKRGKLAELIPSNHSSHFAPVISPTLQMGVDGMALAALTFLT
ncbi:hypothetical protein MMC08_007277 [Hypocenomyce scalaris]|nr:hypothetical protein [Hypocenomyce scalaris]